MHHVILTIQWVTVSKLKYTDDNKPQIYMCNAEMLSLLKIAIVHKGFKSLSDIKKTGSKEILLFTNWIKLL